MAASLICSLIWGGYLPYTIFYGMLSLFIVEFIYIAIQGRFLNIEIAFKSGFKHVGDSIDYLIVIKCDSILPVPYLLISRKDFNNTGKTIDEAVNITLSENTWINENITFLRRGIYNIGRIDLSMYGLLNIFKYIKPIDCKAEIKVYPKLYELKKLSAGGKDIYREVIDFNGTIEDMYAIKDIRKYKRGDNISRIHWKVSAKHGELYVRESDTISGEEYSVFLDLGSKNMLLDEQGIIEESMVDLCVSLCRQACRRGTNTWMFLNAEDSLEFKIENAEGFDSFVEFMVSHKSNGETAFDNYIYQNIHKLNRNSTIAVITGQLDDALANALVNVKNYGYRVVLFYCGREVNEYHMHNLKFGGVAALSLDDILAD